MGHQRNVKRGRYLMRKAYEGVVTDMDRQIRKARYWRHLTPRDRRCLLQAIARARD